LNLYAIVLGLIVAVLLWVSVSQIRKVKTKADYLVAGRSLPWYVLVFTLLSSWIGSGSLFGGAENAFKNGFSALWQPGQRAARSHATAHAEFCCRRRGRRFNDRCRNRGSKSASRRPRKPASRDFSRAAWLPASY